MRLVSCTALSEWFGAGLRLGYVAPLSVAGVVRCGHAGLECPFSGSELEHHNVG